MSAVLDQVKATFARERIHGLWDESRAITEAHWREIAWFRDEIPLSPDRTTFERLEDADMLRVFTARVDGELVGYAVFILSRMLHYDVIQAFCDVVFLRQDHRKGYVASTLLNFAEGQCVVAGAKIIAYHGKVDQPHFGRFMKSRGFEAMDTVFVRRF